ncbi:ribonuclease H-like domain-containing protein [Tanacetum coccineum]
MTGSVVNVAAPSLSDKLALVTHHHLLTRVPLKLDLDDWNYGAWEYFFLQLCGSYEVTKFLMDDRNSTSTSDPTPLTPEELKSAKEAWGFLSKLVKENKRSRTAALETKLCSITLGDLSIEAYFHKVKSLMTILASLDSPVLEDDVAHYVLAGLPPKYDQVCGYMHYQTTLPDLETIRSLLLTEEMRLKTTASPPLADSSSHMVLMTEPGTHSNESNRARGVNNYTNSLLKSLLRKLDVVSLTSPTSNTLPSPSPPTVAFHTGPAMIPPGFVASQPSFGPSGFSAQPSGPPYPPAYVTHPNGTQQPNGANGSLIGPTSLPGQATILPHAFNAETLQDPTNSAWNMDSGASTHINSSINSLSEIFNNCMYSSVSVGDGHTIPVTNVGHSLFPTNYGSLRLNNVLITPHIVKNLISVRQFVRDNNCTIEFDAFGFNVKDFITRQVLLRCDSTRDLYPITSPSSLPRALLVSQHTWHQRLGHPGSEVLRRLVSSNSISCNKEKSPVLCHACQLGKHVRLPFAILDTMVNSCFIYHSGFGSNRPPARLTLHVSSVSPLPKSYRDAFRDPHWLNAMRDEYTALIKNDTWTLVPRPPDTNIVLSHGPVVKPGTIRTVLSLATSRHWPVHQLDVKNAFLHGDLSETVYMHQPPGFRDPAHPDYVCLLQRSLYGLKQAPRAWFQRMDTAYLLLYVDDIVLTASSQDLLQRIIRSLHTEFAMTDLGSLNYFLGISVTRDSSGMFLSQAKYALEWIVVSDPDFIYRSLSGLPTVNVYLYSTDFSLMAVQQFVFIMHDPRTSFLLARKRNLSVNVTCAEAEYRGVANAVAETCWLRNLLRELHTPLSSATLVYCDNVSAVYLSCNPVQHQRTKHIEIDIHFVRDLVTSGQVRVLHVPSRYQFADIFTKGLPSSLFEEFRSSLRVRRSLAPTAGE